MAGLFDPTWWRGVLLISLSHFAIDALSLYSNRLSIRPLRRYMIDQILHIAFIILALIMGGYLEWGQIPQGILASAAASPALTALTGYIFITMPAWVLLKFVVYGMMNGQAPNFPAGPNKFVGISERIVITTLVISGQFLFVPLVAGATGELALVTFDDKVEVVQPFTSDSDKIRLAFLKPQARTGGHRMHAAALEGIRMLNTRTANRKKILLLIGQSTDRGSEIGAGDVLIQAETSGVLIYTLTLPIKATARPMPREPPVTIDTLFSSDKVSDMIHSPRTRLYIIR